MSNVGDAPATQAKLGATLAKAPSEPTLATAPLELLHRGSADRARSPEALDRGRSPEALDRGRSPEALDRGRSPEALDRGRSPEALDRGRSPEALDRGRSPEALDRGRSPEALDRGHSRAEPAPETYATSSVSLHDSVDAKRGVSLHESTSSPATSKVGLPLPQEPPIETLPISKSPKEPSNEPLRDVPVDWEALEDAFENNAPEVHSYLQLATGEVIRVVDGVADPQMHSRIAADAGYLRVDPVSSREQYRWMERFIPLVENPELHAKLSQAIDGKGAFRRFKDVLMAYNEDRERWFTYRSERLRTFMDAWLTAHTLRAVERPAWTADAKEDKAPPSSVRNEGERRRAESFRQQILDSVASFSTRDLEALATYAEFLRTRRPLRQRDEEVPVSAPVPAKEDASL